MWIFGYESLIWNPSISYQDRRLARLDHWVRRFWQGSTDHRGVPGRPGRVVTLISEAGGDCWGIAYKYRDSDSQQVIEKLDLREKGGYHRETVKLNFIDGSTVEGLVYVAGPDNPDYLGPADETDLVTQILSAQGPSGSNRDYLRNLADSLRSLGVTDPHVFSIQSRIDSQISAE